MADEAPPRSDDAVPAEELTPAEVRRRRIRLRLLLTPIVILSFAGVFADWFAAKIVLEHPLLQMMLNGRVRYLLAASNEIDAVPFFVVGFLRQVLTDPLFYLLGLWYGDAALRWMERKTGETGMVPTIKRFFDRYGSIIIAVAPNGYVCLLAGAAGMKIRKFVLLNVVGTIVRLIVIRLVAGSIEPQIDGALDFVKRYQLQIILVSIGLFAFQSISNRARGKKGELQSITSLEKELEAEIDSGTDRPE